MQHKYQVGQAVKFSGAPGIPAVVRTLSEPTERDVVAHYGIELASDGLSFEEHALLGRHDLHVVAETNLKPA